MTNEQRGKLKEVLNELVFQMHHTKEWRKELESKIKEALPDEPRVETEQKTITCRKGCLSCEEAFGKEPSETETEKEWTLNIKIPSSLTFSPEVEAFEKGIRKGREDLKKELLNAFETEEHLIHVEGISMKNWNRVKEIINNL